MQSKQNLLKDKEDSATLESGDGRFSGLRGHPQTRPELIDFRCSPIWQNHYYEEGYTGYRYCTSTSSASEKRLKALEQENIFFVSQIERLNAIIQTLQRQFEEIQTAHKKQSSSNSRRFPQAKQAGVPGVDESTLHECSRN
ncbi:MAG: hypothetical protein KC643_31015 [Nitrospira sp.]|nr:hypothetical protein [Nitrospira sp.]